ncbi:methylmalonyl-CoA mutase family protein [Amycolatopsis acidiphila]|uniref:Fused isobutyryl-CoA mutase n=1 Tax=Amycolatopsis acidiphila TaxID=715473 RepID=A0A558AEW0_9PSEU|nr:fused isobutyryl-CoA mutase/GTPase IcmF [Amycolatopsis acidiphila]TVT22791.1 methylmalonyl-CoA mutase family protein [Amycolatopsis acidiphila]UIJ58197.1 methylmalonyl-CoA mutase family protein [Amycolatopsis acidiphila]GHG69488.1 Fused isobutyryl-CoA mutase [Amycolatopsis acidiphila]
MSAPLYKAVHPVRFVTASSLFDGHDASINIMRRILQSQGAEVVHLGHNRSVDEVATAAIAEDAQGVAISAYQGGHVEYFSYLVELLRERGAGHIRVFGGGGGVIVREEIELLHSRGVARIFSPDDGLELGLPGMINLMIKECDVDLAAQPVGSPADLLAGDVRALSRTITQLQADVLPQEWHTAIADTAKARTVPVLGITGTGGSGKSSLTDELIRRFRLDQQDKLRIAVLAVDPTRRRGGGALLGDRIRMNSLDGSSVYFRSLATRTTSGEIPTGLDEAILACKAAGHDLVIVETPGIGQGDAGIVDHVDHALYVMTPEFGAASQLEKIDMLDFADAVAINKFERRGAEDARRDVARQLVRNREEFGASPDDMPVFGTSAAKFNDDGVTALYQYLRDALAEKGLSVSAGTLPQIAGKVSTGAGTIIPTSRTRYLADIADTVRDYHQRTQEQVEAVRERNQLAAAKAALAKVNADTGAIGELLDEAESRVDDATRRLLDEWTALSESYRGEELVFKVRDKELRTQLWRDTLSGNKVPRVALPRYTESGELLSFLRREHLPGYFPYTAGVFPFKRDGEDPARMFAGEGDAFRTNRRFKYLSAESAAKRLSTAFDSVTLYGHDPDTRPDIYGKVGTSGVSIASVEDMKALYDGFDLTAPSTSVSMTINGPAPTILAFFLNTAIEQRMAAFREEHGREPSAEEAAELREWTLRNVRGTVQADILKEDQGQNTCIFSTEFSLRMMADIQEWFIEHGVRNFYSVSISGYHIAEAGANPISQLAFTLANGFTYVESYLARGMDIDDFAPNLSFFFSNGMDAEYSVLGRVARRIWAVAMKERYGANERSQKLKYHVQTSGRSLHAQEISFNDIRTTLQALCALYDNANSLHTNAFDEAITTPSEHSVRRAMAIQMIINKEWGLSKNENPLQGSFVIDELTDLVEEAVLTEFDRISERGGVLGAMETGYQRGKIQDESMLYERLKHDGSLPIVGVNTFRNPHPEEDEIEVELARATEAEKESQLERVADFQQRHRDEAEQALQALRDATTSGENVFAVLMDAARVCTLGQITEAFFEVGGQYRRNV